MGLFDKFKKKEKPENIGPMFLYSEKELEEVDAYIAKAFDIHLDVCFVPPTDDEPFYKLVTMGAGAYEMKIPEKWKEWHIERAEYVIYVPKDWNLSSDKPDDYWPIKVLKDTARLPIWCDTWLSFGHTLQADEAGTAYAPGTRFNSVILDFCENHQGEVRFETSTGKSTGKTITFYQVIPMFPDELKFKMDTGDAGALFDKFEAKGIEYKVVDNNRRSAID